MKIYVGNLAYSVTEDELRDTFSQHAEVSTVNIIMDRDTGQSKGFGFIEIEDNAKAKEAISALNETDLSGRTLRVNEARPREERRPRY